MAKLVLLALAAAGASALHNDLGNQFGIPTDSMISYDSIYLGFAPDYKDPDITAAYWKQYSGQQVATYNVYTQIYPSDIEYQSFNDHGTQFNVTDILDSGAVLIASVMPYVDWTDLTPEFCSKVIEYFTNTYTNQGTTVWLRFAHEMNYYTQPGTGGANGGPNYPGGVNYDEFFQAWENMYNAAYDNQMIYLYWSPNQDSNENIQPWLPPTEYIDIVGVDWYPVISDYGYVPSFDEIYGDFYNHFAAGLNKPFAIGETGIFNSYTSGDSATFDQRQQWLKNIINDGDYSNYPLYMSATWFEYGPPTNPYEFYIVYGVGQQGVLETISNTEVGS